MTDVTATRLAELAVEALERTAFLISDPMPPEAAHEFDRPSWFSTITYHGSAKGALHLSASDGFVRELASSLLGVEPEEVDMQTHGRDAINELANIVGGSVTLELGSDTQQFSLGLPEEAEPDASPSAGANVTLCFLESEGELLTISHVAGECARNIAA